MTKLYSYFLPQFYPTPENDKFWGQGFTDWVSTRNARSLFEGHNQPFKPIDLVNASNTASGFQRVLSGIGRGLTGIIGFNVASINGLITSRVGYDRIKDLAGEKAAKKLITEELLGGVEKRVTSPLVTASETVGSQELLDRYRKPLNVPQVPRSLIQR